MVTGNIKTTFGNCISAFSVYDSLPLVQLKYSLK